MPTTLARSSHAIESGSGGRIFVQSTCEEGAEEIDEEGCYAKPVLANCPMQLLSGRNIRGHARTDPEEEEDEESEWVRAEPPAERAGGLLLILHGEDPLMREAAWWKCFLKLRS